MTLYCERRSDFRPWILSVGGMCICVRQGCREMLSCWLDEMFAALYVPLSCSSQYASTDIHLAMAYRSLGDSLNSAHTAGCPVGLLRVALCTVHCVPLSVSGW